MPYRRFRRGTLVSPAQKNYHQATNFAIAVNTVTDYNLVTADNGVASNSVRSPCRVRMVYIDFTLYMDAGGGVARVIWGLWKNPGGKITPPTAAQWRAIGTANFDKYLIRVGQGSPGTQTGGVPYRIVGWFKIPRSMQIMNESDTITFSTVADVIHSECGLFVYKWRT